MLLCCWVILCLCLAACWEHKKCVLCRWSFLHFTAQIRAVTGVKINYVSGWQSSYVTGVAAKHHSCCSSYGSLESVAWNKYLCKIRFNFLQYRFHACLSIRLRRSLNTLQRVSHSLSVMYVIFYVTCWNPSWWSYFWLGCVLLGGESTLRMMNSY